MLISRSLLFVCVFCAATPRSASADAERLHRLVSQHFPAQVDKTAASSRASASRMFHSTETLGARQMQVHKLVSDGVSYGGYHATVLRERDETSTARARNIIATPRSFYADEVVVRTSPKGTRLRRATTEEHRFLGGRIRFVDHVRVHEAEAPDGSGTTRVMANQRHLQIGKWRIPLGRADRAYGSARSAQASNLEVLSPSEAAYETLGLAIRSSRLAARASTSPKPAAATQARSQ